MPLYLYAHPKTGKIVEIVQTMNEPHVYVDDKGVKYDRVFTKPQAAVDTRINADNAKDFIDKTKNKRGTIGDLWDQSKELSVKRGGNSGEDPIKQKYYESWSKKRRGKEHPDVKKKKAIEKLSKNFDISL